MKTPEEIKKGLWCCCGQYSASCGKCPYSNNGKDCGTNGVQIMKDAFAFIQQLEAKDTKQYQIIAELNARYSQVSKALCGNENATLEEVLQVINQVTPRTFAIPPRSGKTLAAQRIAELEQDLAAVKRERDAAVFALHGNCDECRWQDTAKCASCVYGIDAWNTHDDCWEWDGVCRENTEVKPND